MATINNVLIPNLSPLSTSGPWNYFWSMTRALKKAGYGYKASGDGTSKDTSSNPAADLWNQTPGSAGVSVASGAAAAIQAPSRGRATVTGLTGIGSIHKGMYLVISGSGTPANNNALQIEEILSATSVRVNARTFAVAADAGPLSWTIRNPVGETYPAGLTAATAWWLGEGASVLKIPIAAAPVAGASGNNFLKGENIVQASTGAEGEIISWVFDTAALTGYLVVAPRLRGTGAGVFGWDTGNVITGDVSGATVTHSGTALEYRHQVVIWKNNNDTNGSIFVGSFEPVGDSAELFSTLAGSAGCTATVAPGGGGTGNAFPAHGALMWGSNTTGTGQIWRGNSATGIGLGQVMVADALEEQNYTADGTWNVALNTAHLAGNGAHNWFSFMRMDDPEDGDLDPYILIHPQVIQTLYTNTRTTLGGVEAGGGAFAANTCLATMKASWTTTRTFAHCWVRRGLAGEFYQDLEQCGMAPGQTGVAFVLSTNDSDPAKIQAAPTSVPAKVMEPCSFSSVQVLRKCVKGSCKWAFVTQAGAGLQLYNGGSLIQLNGMSPGTVVGPWDLSTIPIG